MKKTVAIFLVAILMMTLLTGCGKGREFFDTVDLANYVEICDYKGIEIDTSSQEYIELYAYYVNSDIQSQGLETAQIEELISFDTSAETVVEFGDIVNIDYTGYINNEVFEGGSAEDALLIIGSGNFIDNFEEQLVGAKPGQTVVVNVTFPNEYPNNPDLAGTRAKFVVTVNSIGKELEQIYSLFNIESKEEYIELVNMRAQKSFAYNYLVNNSKVNGYPEDDVDIFYEAVIEYFQEIYGADLSGSNKDDFLSKYIYPSMKEYMLLYYIIDAEQLEIYESTIESQEVENVVIAECYAVNEIVTDYLVDNAVVK